MAKAGEVLNMLCPEIQWVVRNDNYEEIDWLGAQPAITKKQFTDGFDKYDSWKAEQEQALAHFFEIGLDFLFISNFFGLMLQVNLRKCNGDECHW